MEENENTNEMTVENGPVHSAPVDGGLDVEEKPDRMTRLEKPLLPVSGANGVELDEIMSQVAFGQMGKTNEKWLQETVRLGTIKFGNVNTAKQKIFTTGNMALVYRGNKVMRTAPFIMKTDTESKHAWAFFEQHAFYGKKLPPMYLPWERAKTRVIMVGISKDEDYCDNLNGEGYLIKVDENSMAQLPMYARYGKDQMNELLEDSRHNSQVQLLWRQLTGYEKPKTNWMFVGVILLIFIVVVGLIGFFVLFPNAPAQISQALSGALGGFTPPGSPTHGPG